MHRIYSTTSNHKHTQTLHNMFPYIWMRRSIVCLCIDVKRLSAALCKIFRFWMEVHWVCVSVCIAHCTEWVARLLWSSLLFHFDISCNLLDLRFKIVCICVCNTYTWTQSRIVFGAGCCRLRSARSRPFSCSYLILCYCVRHVWF